MGQIAQNNNLSDNLAKKNFLTNPEEFIQGLIEEKYSFPHKTIYANQHVELNELCSNIFQEELQKVIDVVTSGEKVRGDYTFMELLYYCFYNVEGHVLDYEQFARELQDNYYYLRYYFIVKEQNYDLDNVDNNYITINRSTLRILQEYREYLELFFKNERFCHETDPCLVLIKERLSGIHPDLKSKFLNFNSVNYSDLSDISDCHIDICTDAYLSQEQKKVSEEILKNFLIPKLQNLVTIVETFTPCDLVLFDSELYLTLHFENLEISNERGDTTIIESLYYFAPIIFQRELSFSPSREEELILSIGREIRGYVNKHKISEIKVPPTKRNFNESRLLTALMKEDFNDYLSWQDEDDISSMFSTMYQHSHLSSNFLTSSPNSFCIGSGDIYNALNNFESNNFINLEEEELENTISYYFYLINSYIKYESVDGVPYIYISEKQSLKNAMMILSSEEEKKTVSIPYKSTDNSGNIKDHSNLISYLRAIKNKDITTENAIEFFLESYGSTLTDPVRRRLARRTKVFSHSTAASATVRRVMNITREEIMKVCIEIDFQRNTLSSLNFYKDVLGEVTIFQTEKNVKLIQELFMNLFKLRHLVLGIYSLMENMQKGRKWREPSEVFLMVTNHFLPKELKKGFSTKFKLDFEGTYKFFYENFEIIFSIYEEEMTFLFCAELLISEERQEETKKGIANLLHRYKQITNRFFNGEQEREVSMNLYSATPNNENIKNFYFKGEQVKRIIVDNSSELCEELSPLIEETPEQEEQHITDIINKVKQIPPVFTEGFIKQLEDELSK